MEEIDRAMYEKYAGKLRQERDGIEAEFSRLDFGLSNLPEFVAMGLVIASRMGGMWDSGDYRTRQRLQKRVFPEGIKYNRETAVIEPRP